jgi:hypothetical protein
MTTENLIKITFTEAIQNHKDLVNKSIWILRNSEIDECDYPIYDIVWFYSYLFVAHEIIEDKQLYHQMLEMELEDRVKEELKHTIVNFCMTTPDLSVMFKLKEIPQKVEEIFRKKTKQQMYLENWFDKSKDISIDLKADIWDVDDLKINLQKAIDEEDYEKAAEIQKQIDTIK